MKRLNFAKMRLVLVGFVVAIVLGGGTAKADFIFGEPAFFDEPVNSSGIEIFECISTDGLEIYISRPIPINNSLSMNYDLYVSTRATTNDPWSVPVSLGSTVNSSYLDYGASLSNDGLELYFCSNRPDGYGSSDIWITTRPYKGADWGTPVNLGPPINTSDFDWLPWITPEGLKLYFSSNRPGGYGGSDIWVSTRGSTNDEWEEPVNLGPVVNSTVDDCYPCLSPDGLVLFFSDWPSVSGPYRPGGLGRSDMWMTRRKSIADPWEPPVNLGPDINTNEYDDGPHISPDGYKLNFTHMLWGSPSSCGIWQAPIIPIVDLNSDGTVDSADMCIMVDYWGTDDSLCDIGPMPWGDGVVDVEDLKVLAEHLFEEVDDPTLIVHWPLDEVQGDIAYNNASDCDGILMGGPVWQPDAGMVDGALQFDGIDDYVVTEYVLNPTDGPFSILAWVKGDTPGQVILSQIDSANWLCTDLVGGYLITQLQSAVRGSAPLLSNTCITDNNWHEIGFVWDGSYRYLYVDGVEVAKDNATLPGLISAESGLFFGTGCYREQFFSGLIDDVRIYNRVVSP